MLTETSIVMLLNHPTQMSEQGALQKVFGPALQKEYR
jgi:hypothetical protein